MAIQMQTAIESLNRQINSTVVEVITVFGSPGDIVYGFTLRTKDGKTISIRADMATQRVDATTYANQYLKIAPVLEVFVNVTA